MGTIHKTKFFEDKVLRPDTSREIQGESAQQSDEDEDENHPE